jgi:ThiF family
MAIKVEDVRSNWSSAEAFYRERDNRTELEVIGLGTYVNVPIEICVEPSLADDLTVQRMTLFAANLTARWARNVKVVLPHVELIESLRIYGDKTLADRVEREMHQADPFGHFEIGPSVRIDGDALRLRIGLTRKWSSTAPDTEYAVDATGWSSIGRRGQTISSSFPRYATAPAAALAAALGAADLFKRAVGHERRHWMGNVDWCMWTHNAVGVPGKLIAEPYVAEGWELGNLLVAGIGAVGSALLYILATTPCIGRITLLDRDRVETSNLNRSPLFTAIDAALSRNKTTVGREAIEAPQCRVETVEGSWHEVGQGLSAEAFDVWVSLTNEGGAWAEVPFQLPPVVLHGTTTSGWGVAAGRHIPRVEDCTACRLPRPTAVFRGPCAQGELSSNGLNTNVTASLPFLSATAGALVAAELLKLRFPGVSSLPNSVCADFRHGIQAVIPEYYGPTKGCRGCEMAKLPLWSMRGGLGRFSTLSTVEQL